MSTTTPRTYLAERIGRRLTRARERAGLSRREVLERLGVDPATCLCGQWERGECSPSAGNLVALCHILGTTPNMLLPWRIRCVECGHPVDISEDGGEGCELSTGAWVCSSECWDKKTSGG